MGPKLVVLLMAVNLWLPTSNVSVKSHLEPSTDFFTLAFDDSVQETACFVVEHGIWEMSQLKECQWEILGTIESENNSTVTPLTLNFLIERGKSIFRPDFKPLETICVKRKTSDPLIKGDLNVISLSLSCERNN